MSTQSNAMPESPAVSQAVAPAAISPTRLLYWSLRRELWENRSIYIAPLAVAAIFLFGFLLSLIHLPAKMRAASALTPAQQHEIIQQPYSFVALLLMGTTLLVAIFYCLDALHGERRDRSILFWKSLPVSDLMTVLSKASIPVLVLPLITFAITIATQWIMLMLHSVVLLGSGLSVAPLWTHLSLFQMGLFGHLIGFHGFWYAPIFAWLLLVSAWARRATFLWAALPPLSIGVIEKIAFNTSYFVSLLGNRFTGPGPTESAASTTSAMESMIESVPANFLLSPGLWIGLAITAVFLAAAVRLRRYQGPI
jgi:ABC-2 type transport system permease protein